MKLYNDIDDDHCHFKISIITEETDSNRLTTPHIIFRDVF